VFLVVTTYVKGETNELSNGIGEVEMTIPVLKATFTVCQTIWQKPFTA
jgi:hypothetical protein